ncbi:unnamed protein product, partial [Pocillopora meandrina]
NKEVLISARLTEGTAFYGCYRGREIIFLFLKSYQRTLNRTHTRKQTEPIIISSDQFGSPTEIPFLDQQRATHKS